MQTQSVNATLTPLISAVIVLIFRVTYYCMLVIGGVHPDLMIRRNVVASDGVLDHVKSLVIEQANNRTFAAQAVLQEFLTNG